LGGSGVGGGEEGRGNVCNKNAPSPSATLYLFFSHRSHLVLHPQTVPSVYLIVRTDSQQQNLLFAGLWIVNELEENPDIVANAASPRS